MKFVVTTENDGPKLVEATNEMEAVLATPGGLSGRIAQLKDIEAFESADNTKKVKAHGNN